MRCPDCQNDNPPSAAFCNQCGARQSQAAAKTPEPSAPTLERRHLTAMFCDLVDSTRISNELDPEDFVEMLHAYRTELTEIVKQHQGYIGRFLGDGLLAYFGYPIAAEDDATRACRAALQMSTAVAKLQEPNGAALASRIGIATGIVVARDIVGEGADQEHAISGDTPNLAARLQGQATPNTIMISPATRQLVGDQFAIEDLGMTRLKGFREPTQVHRLGAENALESRFVSRHTGLASNLIGRSDELATLQSLYDEVQAGSGKLVLVSGEAGLGKSRLVHEFRAQHAEDFQAVFQCSAQHQNSMLYPFLQQLAISAELKLLPDTEAMQARIREVIDPNNDFVAAHPLLYDLFAVESKVETPKTAAALQLALAALSARFTIAQTQSPAVLLLEDAHWIDPTSEELVQRLAAQLSNLRILLIITHRPEYKPDWVQSGTPQITLAPLTALDTENLSKSLLERLNLPANVTAVIVDRADGNPLYIEELSRNILENEALQTKISAGEEALELIPDTLQDLLMARLDKLGEQKHILQLGSLIGRTFSVSLLTSIAEMSRASVVAALAAATEMEYLTESGTLAHKEYSFRHALLQDAAYESLLKRERRSLHGKVALTLQNSSVAITQPEVVAHHLSQAEQHEEALVFWEQGGILASERSANTEALHHLGYAVKLLTSNLVSQNQAKELDIRVRYAGAIRATQGYAAPAAGAEGQHILDLARATSQRDVELQALNGLYSFHLVRSDYAKAEGLAAQLLTTAQAINEPTYIMIGHRAVGIVAFHLGAFDKANTNMQLALDHYDVDEHVYMANVYGADHAETVASYLCLSRWVSGNPDDAITLQSWAIEHSEKIDHAHSIAQAVAYRAMLLCLNRDWAGALADSNRVVPYATDRGLKLMEVFGKATGAIASAHLSPTPNLVNTASDAVDGLNTIAPKALQPYLQTELAHLQLLTDNLEKASEALILARQTAEATSEIWAHAETKRIESRLLRRAGDTTRASLVLQESIDIAASQDATMWLLRSTSDLFEHNPNQETLQLLNEQVVSIDSHTTQYDIIRAKSLIEQFHT